MPDDPELEEMDPFVRMWMFSNWIEDYNEQVEVNKNLSYLIGSFINPEMVKKILETNTVSTTDEDFEKSFEMVLKHNNNIETEKPKRRRKKKIKGS